uniref:DUF1937 domain-containing protein n=1 Tax=viral metagenome TaxID=1070528 RepID=A0A6H1ZG60_9ZZZZ
MKKNPGYCVFNPIGHSHPPSLFLGNGLSHDFWLMQDFSFLDRWADVLLIHIEVSAWKHSKGIVLEMGRFTGQIRPVFNNGEIG